MREDNTSSDVTDDFSDTVSGGVESDAETAIEISETESDETDYSAEVVYEDTETPQTEAPLLEVSLLEAPLFEGGISADSDPVSLSVSEPETQPVIANVEKVQKPPNETQAPETIPSVIKETAPPETQKEPEIITETLPQVTPEVIPEVLFPPPVDVYGVLVSSNRRYYKIGESASLTVDIYPHDAENKNYTLTVISGNADISDNKISLYGEGSVTVRATCDNGVYGEIVLESIDVAKYAGEVLKYTNIERTKIGLSELSASDTALSSVSSIRVNELVKSYSHERPDGSDCYALYDEKEIKYTTAAENIAKGYSSPENIVKVWMSSPGHMKNILNPDFTKVGVSVEMDSDGVLYWAQNFSN